MSEPETKKSGGLMKKVALAVVVLAIAGGAAAGGYLWSQKSAGVQAAEPAAAVPAPPPVATGLVALEPFLVNLADAGRFLRVSMNLVVADDAAAKAVTGNSVVLMRVRSALLELLTQQTAADLVTPEGKNALKTRIQERAAEVSGVAVADVLFADFVVQF